MSQIQPFTQQTFSELLRLADRPNLSVYMPTHRSFPERTQDPIRLKNLIKQLEQALAQQFSELPAQALLAPFQALLDDQAFWNTCPEGLALFGGVEHFMVIGLHQRVPEVAIVNSHPYLKPLLRLAPLTDRFQVMCLSRDKVCAYEGTAERLQAMQLPVAVPSTLEAALGDELTPRNQQGHPDGFSASSERGDPMMHESGGGGKQDEINLDRERFFRMLDRSFSEHCSKKAQVPLVLVALPENQAVFRAVSRNSLLLPTGIDQDPGALSLEQLGKQCGAILRARHNQKLDDAINRYGVAVGQRLSASELPDIAHAAAEGKVALLLVEAERWVDGSMDQANGEVVLRSADQGPPEDVLDELILGVIRHGGEVMVVPPERLMPTDTGAAAVYRY